ncbi:MAG: TetR/AcrR family transcriptional regulator [Spongiibacter sp.]
MMTELDDLAIARRPSQARSRERFEKVIAAADAMLAEGGLGALSIPALADKLGMTRRSIYLFFPTHYAVLNEVTRRYINRLEQRLAEELAQYRHSDLHEAVARVTFAAADFHNTHPVGCQLILGGAVTDSSYRAQEMNTRHLGQLARRSLGNFSANIPTEPDVASLAIELGTACFRHSYGVHGKITDSYKVEATYVMLLYLCQTLGLGDAPSREALSSYL